MISVMLGTMTMSPNCGPNKGDYKPEEYLGIVNNPIKSLEFVKNMKDGKFSDQYDFFMAHGFNFRAVREPRLHSAFNVVISFHCDMEDFRAVEFKLRFRGKGKR